MDYYEFREWIGWSVSEIREYAREIAEHQSLTLAQAKYLETEMTTEAGYWPDARMRTGPVKMNADTEERLRSLGGGDDEVLQQNRRMNLPFVRQRSAQKFQLEERLKTVGSGLTRRRLRKVVRESASLKKERKRARRRSAMRPFTVLIATIRTRSRDAMWSANCYPIDSDDWLIPRGNDAPFDGLVWYARELQRAYFNARDQAQLGNTEAAMWHAFNAGALCTELEMRLAHGETFAKYEAVRVAQQDAARSRKTVSDESRIEAYWRHRKDGNKRIEAGRLAASELGLSEPSIRNAFPDGKYPAD